MVALGLQHLDSHFILESLSFHIGSRKSSRVRIDVYAMCLGKSRVVVVMNFDRSAT